jgi:hypothetical protein
MSRSLFVLLFFFFSFQAMAQVEQVTENQVGISRRLQHEIDITKDPKLGYVPKAKLVDAYKDKTKKVKDKKASMTAMGVQTGQVLSAATLAAAGGFTWTERGPFSDAVGPSNGNTRPGNGKTSGRVRAIWQDLNDATGNTLWVGGIDGGLWKTTSINVNPANWTNTNDFFANMAVSSICQDPSSKNILYFGTGEKTINADAVRGAGVWRSIDNGITWDIIPGSVNFWNVSKVICDAAGNLYVGCNTISNNAGLQRLLKGSSTWENITPSGLDGRIADMELSNNGKLHISCGYYNSTATGYRYTTAPATVTPSTWTSPLTTFTTNYNVDLASNGDVLYALPANSSFEVATIFKSVNGGVNWSATAATPAALTNGQGWYNMAVAIDPNNVNNVIVGGLDCFRTTNGGTSWTKISNWVGTTGQYVHADQQAMLWNSNNRVIVASDGGIHLSNDGGTTFSDRNIGLNIKQFYSLAIHPTSTNYFLGGTQDNGVHQLKDAGISTSVEVTGGDGAFVHIDQNQPQYQWGSYVYSNYRRSSDGGNTWSSVTASNTGRFINPTDYDDINNIMYGSFSANTFARWSNAQTGGTLTSVAMSTLGNGTVSAVKVSPYTSNLVFFGGGGSGVVPTLIKAVAANATPTFTNIIGASMKVTSTNISSVEMGTNDNNIIVCFSNYGINNVWVTNDGGTTWAAVDGNLPNMPVRWAMFYPGDNSKAIIATETGVWQTSLINGASTIWDPEASFPNVRTDMLQFRASDATLAASTHGRGIFSTVIASLVPLCGNISGLTASAINLTGATLGWGAVTGALSYDVDYKLTTALTWTNAATATTATSIVLSGLANGTAYDVRVRSKCVAGDGLYATTQFTTLVPCGAVTGLSATSITASGAVLRWTALSGATSYTVDYKLASATTWTNRLTNSNVLTTTLTGLTASSVYDYRVRANCASGPGAFVTAQFTTAAPCPGPSDVSTNGTAAGAGPISLNTDIKGTISSSTDIDFYKFTIATGGTATITLTTLPANYALTLYASNGTTTLGSSNNASTANETIAYTFAAGTFVIKVNGVSKAFNASNCYTLRVQGGTATGATLSADEFAGSIVDPYSLQAAVAEKSIAVKLYPNPAKDKVTLYMIGGNDTRHLNIYDARGAIVYHQQIKEMFTTLSLQKLANGVFYFRIVSEKGEVLFNEKLIKN